MTCPLIQQINYCDPLTIFARFADQEGAIFLDSAALRPHCGRYSFIGVDPFIIFSSKNKDITINGQSYQGNPFSYLEQWLARFTLDPIPDLPPFQGGVAGFFGYDLYQHLENIPLHKMDDLDFPDLILGFYDVVVAFDHDLKKACVFSSGWSVDNVCDLRARNRLNWIINELNQMNDFSMVKKSLIDVEVIQSNFTQSQYESAVQQGIDYILNGDIFEVCLSQRFVAELPSSVSPFDLYCRLRILNPAPFAAYFHVGDNVIASASPERFLKINERNVESRPIKGTRPRSKDPEIDLVLAEELKNSQKDHAENVMIVDLLRNDLSRVCEDKSVKVPQLCGLESYATVHHLVSVITGRLRENNRAIDLLKAAFPGGSITGAPKVRAMEIIAEIEPNQRGPYCGSIGYINFNGDMDISIAIRTYAIKHNRVTFQAGGAIVADSNPLDEYEETLTKAQALKRALTHDFVD